MNALSLARSGLVAAMLACVAFAGSAVPAAAQSAIRVLVNDEPITTYDIQARAKMLRVFSQGKQGEKDAVEQLIDEQLMLAEAGRRKVTISDAQVDAEFARRAQQVKMNATQFQAAMRQAGIDVQTFRNFLRANMAWTEIVRARFRATVQISEQDVAAALGARETPEEQVAAYEFMLQQILFVIPAKAGGGEDAKQRNAAAAFRSGFSGCDNSLQQAQGMPTVVVKPTVRREESQISEALKEALKGLEPGGITAPQRVEEGYQLVAVCAKKEIPGQTVQAEEVRSELSSERGQMLARRYLRDLRSDAVIEYR